MSKKHPDPSSMSEQHPADALVEALLDYSDATHQDTPGEYYVAGYLNAVLRQIVNSLPEGLEKRAAHMMLRQKTKYLKDQLQFLKDQNK